MLTLHILLLTMGRHFQGPQAHLLTTRKEAVCPKPSRKPCRATEGKKHLAHSSSPAYIASEVIADWAQVTGQKCRESKQVLKMLETIRI